MCVTHHRNSKIQMRWFLNEARYSAEKRQTNFNLESLIPDKNNSFGVSLVLDFSTP